MTTKPSKATDTRHDERAFVDLWWRKRSESIALVFLVIGAGVGIVINLVVPLIANPQFKTLVLRQNSINLAVDLLLLAFSRRLRAVLPSLVLPLHLSSYGLWIYLTHLSIGINSFDDILLCLTVLISVSFYLILLSPFRTSITVALAVTYWLMAYGAIYESPWALRWIGVFASVLASAVAFQHAQNVRTREQASAEYRVRHLIAPRQIVNRTLGTDDIEKIFVPQMRDCICVSSDWRNYQELTSQVAPDALSNALSAYYDQCEALLRQYLPEGNYYTDWIADEFFVVVFKDEGMSTEDMTRSAMDFAYALVSSRATFAERHGMPRAIDAGLASGSAYIGMMGPEGFKKATALGAIPGRSRRMQAAGKMLRRFISDRDRVVFGMEVLMHLPMDYDLTQVGAYKANRVLRDLMDVFLYHREAPGASDSVTTEAEDEAA